MAVCLRKIHSSISKAGSLPLGNCKVASGLLFHNNNTQEIFKNILWVAARASTFTYRPASKLQYVQPGRPYQAQQQPLPSRRQSPTAGRGAQLMGCAPSLQLQKHAVCLSDLYAKDPLSILLLSQVQVFSSLDLQQPHSSSHQLPPFCESLVPQAYSTASSDGISRQSVWPAATSVLCSGPMVPGSSQTSPSKSAPDSSGLPTQTQLNHVHDVLVKDMMKFFSDTRVDTSIYEADVVLENRINGRISVGLQQFGLQLVLLHVIGHLKYLRLKLDILTTTTDCDLGIIKLRWRIAGIKPILGLNKILNSMKFGFKDELHDNDSIWYDAISTLYVNSSGKVTRHVVDNKMMDEGRTAANRKSSLGAKIAVAIGLVPRSTVNSSLEDLNPCLY